MNDRLNEEIRALVAKIIKLPVEKVDPQADLFTDLQFKTLGQDTGITQVELWVKSPGELEYFPDPHILRVEGSFGHVENFRLGLVVFNRRFTIDQHLALVGK